MKRGRRDGGFGLPGTVAATVTTSDLPDPSSKATDQSGLAIDDQLGVDRLKGKGLGLGGKALWVENLNKSLEQRQEERDQEKLGFHRWRIKDFGGAYHLYAIKSKFPIAGSNVEIERLRIGANKEKAERISQMEKEIQERSELNAAIRGDIVQASIKLKATYGERTYIQEDIHSVLDSREEELAKIKDRHRREKQAYIEEDYDKATRKRVMKFFQYIRNRDFEPVQDMLELRLVDPNIVEPDSDGRTALIIACDIHSVSLVEILLNHGADPNQKNGTGLAPIHVMWNTYYLAGKSGNDKLVKVAMENIHGILDLFIKHHIKLGLQDEQGDTVLHVAAKENLTSMAYRILISGSLKLLQIKNKAGRTPLEMGPKEGETHKLISNWEICLKASRMNEFYKQWSKYMYRAEPGPRLSLNQNAHATIEELNLMDSMRDGAAILRENLAQQRVIELQEHLEARGGSKPQETKIDDSLVENDEVIKRPVSDYVRQAQAQYTPAYRRRIEAERKKMKPSERKLTLIEYLVGPKGLQKAAEYGKPRKRGLRGNAQEIKNRRLSTARSLLSDKYKGGPAMQQVTDSMINSFKYDKDVAHPNDVLMEAPMVRPWTSSTLAKPGGMSRMDVMLRTSSQIINEAVTHGNNVASISQRFAKRNAKIPRDFMKRPERVDHPFAPKETEQFADVIIKAKSEQEQDEMEKQLQSSAVKDTVPRLQRQGTVKLSDLSPDMNHAVNDEGEEEEAIVPRPKTTASTSRRQRRHGVSETKTGGLEIGQDLQNRLMMKSNIKNISTSHKGETYLEPELLPPMFDESKIYAKVKRTEGCKDRFNFVELVDAVGWAKEQLGEKRLPKLLQEAILRSVSPDEKHKRGTVTIDELRRRFKGFLIDHLPFNTEPVFKLLEEILIARHRFDMLHPSLDPYINFINYKPRTTRYEQKPINPEPWKNAPPTVFDNAKRFNHEENPMINKQFFPKSMMLQF